MLNNNLVQQKHSKNIGKNWKKSIHQTGKELFPYMIVSSMAVLLAASVYCAKEEIQMKKNKLKEYVQETVLKSKNEELAFLKAIMEHRNEDAKKFILMGEDLNKQYAYGITPLMVAACYGNQEIVKELLKYGADSLVKDQMDNSAKEYASFFKHYEIETMLHHNSRLRNFLERDWKYHKDNLPPLLSAIYNGETRKAHLHANIVGAVHKKDMRNRSPLMYAAALGDRDMFDYLLQKGANITEMDSYNFTVVDYASLSQDKDLVNYVLSKFEAAKAKQQSNEAAQNPVAIGKINISIRPDKYFSYQRA